MRLDRRSATTTMEEVATNRPHFRLKVDLSKFFHDARRFCWIFVDGTKIKQVIHMKQHISKLFNIEEPFHLLLNDTEYLPPIEDVRILKENETILLVPLYLIDIFLQLEIFIHPAFNILCDHVTISWLDWSIISCQRFNSSRIPLSMIFNFRSPMLERMWDEDWELFEIC